jgi:hypothetical protein
MIFALDDPTYLLSGERWKFYFYFIELADLENVCLDTNIMVVGQIVSSSQNLLFHWRPF